jgi:hypothetical protein
MSHVSPNELLAALRAMSIDADALVFGGSGYSSDSIYHQSLEACAESISRVLNNKTTGRRKRQKRGPESGQEAKT